MQPPRGGMAEWLKAHAWKACIRETVSWVRIPLPPPAHQVALLSPKPRRLRLVPPAGEITTEHRKVQRVVSLPARTRRRARLVAARCKPSPQSLRRKAKASHRSPAEWAGLAHLPPWRMER